MSDYNHNNNQHTIICIVLLYLKSEIVVVLSFLLYGEHCRLCMLPGINLTNDKTSEENQNMLYTIKYIVDNL